MPGDARRHLAPIDGLLAHITQALHPASVNDAIGLAHWSGLAMMDCVAKTFVVFCGGILASALVSGCSSAHAAEPRVVAASAPYPYVAPTGSMERTIHAGQTVMAQPVTNYRGRAGDIVVFRGPPGWQSDAAGEAEFLKRVIAVGGQTVQCCNSRGQVLIDGQPLKETYIYYLPAAGPANQAGFGPVRVPNGTLWMMGDSRNNSADSRFPGHGPVPEKSVIAIVRPAAGTR